MTDHYWNPGKGWLPIVTKGPTRVGKLYRPTACECLVPPWISCACDLPAHCDHINQEADERLQLALLE
jgi:hypothetical protein